MEGPGTVRRTALEGMDCLLYTSSFLIALVTAGRLLLYLTPAVMIVILVFVIAGLFSKVLSQVFDRAVAYKLENDLTI